MGGGSVRNVGSRLAAGLLAGLSGLAVPSLDLAAKEPGRVHCYRDVCHRVRSIEETRRLIGRTLSMDASYYDDASIDRFNRGSVTSDGEAFDAQSPGRVSSSDLPDGTELLLRNPANGLTSHVRVNDFGPFYGSRLIDVTRRVAQDLGFARKGVTPLEVTIIAAPLPDEATFRRNRVSPPALGHIGIVEAAEMPTLVRRLIGNDRRLAIQARRSSLPEIAASIAPLAPDEVDTLAPSEPTLAALSAMEVPADAVVARTHEDAVDIAALDDPARRDDTMTAADLGETATAAIASAEPAASNERATPLAERSIDRRVLASTRATAESEAGAEAGSITSAVFEARFTGNRAALVSLALAALASLALYGMILRTGPGTRAGPGRVRHQVLAVEDTLARATMQPEPATETPSISLSNFGEQPLHAAPATPAAYISPEITITGGIVARGAIAIAGHVVGDVRAEAVEILEGGRVLGHVEAAQLVVAGTLRGTARTQWVHATGTGCLFADLEYQSLTAEPGSFIDGTLRKMCRASDADLAPRLQLAS